MAVCCFLVLRYDKEILGSDHHIDVRLVLLWIGEEEDDRVMKWIGYLETLYKEMRDWDGIYEDLWSKYVQPR